MADASPSDVDLARSIAGGDESALGRAYDAYSSFVYSLALRVTGNADDADEVLQDVFLTLWRTAGRFDPQRGTLAGYLATLSRNRALDRLRSKKARPDRHGTADPQDFASAAPDPASTTAAVEAGTRARAALSSLPADERRVLAMAYFDGLSQSEIAERTGDPLGTVKGRTRNALRRLRALLPPSLGGGR